jgi:hypothetical protein
MRISHRTVVAALVAIANRREQAGMSEQEHATAWARYTGMIPEELRGAGWTPWIFYSGVTLFGDLAHRAVLRKNPFDPSGAQAAGDGATKEEALRGAIREALDIEATSQAQPPQG